ncbi:hypothetical protein KYK29_19075 [Shinella daejeonensis]|uniref:hypothetical protein n=1 Tax=Shinella daejeonensis TaxID=659017 RepID=UPI0020C7F632|nr:hypothetical protein [Shinella daejeonensis]MCP8897035.1 hypothetical protein [Shinella daejeonensis]
MAIDRKVFFDRVRERLFDGRLRQAQVDGLTAILDRWEAEMPTGDRRWLAYMLGTAHHETGRTMQAVRETFAASDERAIAILDKAFRDGRLAFVRAPYWRKDRDGRSWLGRGLVQLTHKANYQRMTQETGIDLVADPARAMELSVAVTVMFTGMTGGAFTGRRLADYFSPGREDWINARRIVNGTERAALVAGYARAYHAAIGDTAQPARCGQ